MAGIPNPNWPFYTDYYGSSHKQPDGVGLIVVNPGTLNTDRYGLDTAIATWKCRVDTFGSLAPGLGSIHPVWRYLTMEKRQVDLQVGFCLITGDYVGLFSGSTPHIWECSFGSSDEEIQNHPLFVSNIAGKPSAPLNAAIFIDPKTRLTTKNDSPGKSLFNGFSAIMPDGSLNKFAGIVSFLSPQVTLRETWISYYKVDGINMGKINFPSTDFAIQLPPGANWLKTGASYQQRGGVFQNTVEWRASGIRGWNDVIYG